MANISKMESPKTSKPRTKRSPSRWTITGVTKKTREAVERAAKKDEIPVGKWIDRTLRDAAERQLQGGPPAQALPSGLLDTLNDLTQRVKALGEGSQALQQVQKTASELGDHVTSTYDALSKQTEKAVEDVRTWMDKTLEETAKWGGGVIEQLKTATATLQKRVTNGASDDVKALPDKSAGSDEGSGTDGEGSATVSDAKVGKKVGTN